MKTSLTILTVASLSLVACHSGRNGAFPVHANSTSGLAVEGDYKATNLEVALFGPKTKEVMTIGPNFVRVASVCKAGFQKVIADVTVPAIVTPSQIVIQKSETKTVMLGSSPCTVSVEARVMAYDLTNGLLTLTPEGGATYVYGQKIEPKVPSSSSFGWRPSSASSTSSATQFHYFPLYGHPYWASLRASSSSRRNASSSSRSSSWSSSSSSSYRTVPRIKLRK